METEQAQPSESLCLAGLNDAVQLRIHVCDLINQCGNGDLEQDYWDGFIITMRVFTGNWTLRVW